MASSIPQTLLQKLQLIEPDSSFSGSLPRVQSSSGATYYVKTGSLSDEARFRGEAESLKAMDEAAPFLVPRLLDFGHLESGLPYFISEHKDIGPLSYRAADILAKRMATELHAKSNPSGKGFGLAVPTYCGLTKLQNGWFKRWDECFASMIGDLLSQLEQKGQYQTICSKGIIVKNEWAIRVVTVVFYEIADSLIQKE